MSKYYNSFVKTNDDDIQDVEYTKVSRLNVGKLPPSTKRIVGGKGTESFFRRTKQSVNGAMLGAGIGLVAALLMRRSKMLFMIAGAFGGGIMGDRLISLKNTVVDKVKEKADELENVSNIVNTNTNQ